MYELVFLHALAT